VADDSPRPDRDRRRAIVAGECLLGPETADPGRLTDDLGCRQGAAAGQGQIVAVIGEPGTLHTMMGQREQARDDLSTAVELYKGMDMTFWLPQAEAALAQVQGR